MKELEKDLWLVDNIAVQDELTKIRDKRAHQTDFRKGIVKLGCLCGFELMEILDRREAEVETPLAIFKGTSIKDKEKIVIINVLRAASPLVEGLLKAFPLAKQGVIGAKRKEEERMKRVSFDIKINYIKVPPITDNDVVIVADPMLATGSTLLSVMKHLIRKNHTPKKLILLSLVSTRIGIDRIRLTYPDASIITASIDPLLNDAGYIVPGLGDVGDRAFGSV